MPTVTPIDQSSDQEIFDAAIAPDAPVTPEPSPEPSPPPAPEPQAAPVETTGGRLKDPVTGKFVAKGAQQEVEPPRPSPPEEPQPPEAAEPDAEPQMPASVPSWRLAEEAQRRRDAEAQNQELTQHLRQMQMQMAQLQRNMEATQTPQAQIDPIADPEGFYGSVQANVQKEIQSIRLESNLQIAQFKHGEVFDNAYEAFVENSYKGDQSTYLRVMRSPNPGEAMVQWFKERETFAKIGTDPDAWLKGELEKRMADPAFQAEVIKRFQAGQGNGATPANTQVQIPPSLTRVAAAAPAAEASQDVTDEGLWNYATAKR